MHSELTCRRRRKAVLPRATRRQAIPRYPYACSRPRFGGAFSLRAAIRLMAKIRRTKGWRGPPLSGPLRQPILFCRTFPIELAGKLRDATRSHASLSPREIGKTVGVHHLCCGRLTPGACCRDNAIARPMFRSGLDVGLAAAGPVPSGQERTVPAQMCYSASPGLRITLSWHRSSWCFVQ